MSAELDVLIPTYRRPAALAVTLATLLGQSFSDFRVIVSNQTEDPDPPAGEVEAVVRVLRAHGHEVQTLRHLPRRGLAEQRQFLLDRSSSPYVLYLDDDLILEPWVLGQMLGALRELAIGFVGCAVIGLSYLDDVRPDQQRIELWEGPVEPEEVRPDSPAWERHKLHNAANLYHVQRKLGVQPTTLRAYRVAWVGGCVLYDSAKLRAAGSFQFWRELPPEHSGEDVLAQLRVMSRFGGCGLIPSGVYHQELPTTVPHREFDAPRMLPAAAQGAGAALCREELAG